MPDHQVASHGYKQTDVGVIPNDWNVSPLGRLILSVEYGSSAKSNATGHTAVLRMGNLQGGTIDWHDLVFSDDESEIRKYMLKPGDVLFNRTNTIDLVGKTAIYTGDCPAIFAGYLIRINVNKTLLDSSFLNYVLNAEFSKQYSAKVLSVAVGQANINAQKLKTYPIPLPPTKAEQEAIVDALCAADALIDSLEQLLVKKRDLKNGAMQELLTGKKRLPGFATKPSYKQTEIGLIPEEWETKTIEQISTVGRGRVISHREIARSLNPTYPVYSSQTSHNGVMGYLDTFEFEGDYITWTTDGANAGTVFCRNGRFNCTNVCGTVKLKSDNHPFVAKVLGKFAPRHVSRHLGNPKLMNDVMKRVTIPLPPTKDEQEAIAAILSDMDAEIVALEAKLAKARQIKQGMMQELLTGRIRLV
jgi:type I restriction enzyme S subunit